MATITEDYCSKEIYRLLIEKGFDGEIHTTFDEEGYTQPSITLQMAMKWLRNVHGVYYDILLLLGDKAEKYGDLQLGVYQLSSSGAYKWECWLYADTYEELYEKYVRYCLENLIK